MSASPISTPDPDLDAVERIFHEARAIDDPGARARHARAACGSDDALHREVLSLLAAEVRIDRFMATRSGADSTPRDSSSEPAPTEDGDVSGGLLGDRYRLLQRLGEGGFGIVWLAEQRHPVVRKVALKIIKPGMDSRQVIARFEAERQALAMMDHPGIARVLDAGTTRDGRPYFVMELVAGEPITRFCDEARLPISERLQLFRHVCAAVQHAHTKGVVHRDLKPANVLVTLTDGVPTPKVIDFGIAKALGEPLTDRTLCTHLGQFVGTPAYMSPEQAAGSPDVDTRTDIYALGALLYELLTGMPPFDEAALRAAPLDELVRMVRETDPPKPSTRLGTVGSLGAIAARRRTEPARLGRIVRGELDWIVMRAIEKDRRLRYETASALGEDVLAHLEGRPVRACPPSMAYVARKFCRRHRTAVGVVGAVAALLLLGAGGTSVGLLRSREANRRLEATNAELDRALHDAESQRERAEAEAERAAVAEATATRRAEAVEQVATFQEMQLREVDPSAMGATIRRVLLEQSQAALQRAGRDPATVTAELNRLDAGLAGVSLAAVALRALDESIFQRTIAAIEGQFVNQPLIRARLLGVAGKSMHDLGLHEAALHPLEEALSICEREPGAADPRTELARLELAYLFNSLGRYADPEATYRVVIASGALERREDQIQASRALGSALRELGRLDEAAPLLLAALAEAEAELGDDHVVTIAAINGLARLRSSQGDGDEAGRLYGETLVRRERVMGVEHPYTIQTLLNLGAIHHRAGRLEDAEACAAEALRRARAALGHEHPTTLHALNAMAATLKRRGRLDEAVPFALEAMESSERAHGALHPDTSSFAGMLASLREARGELDAAEALYRRAIEGMSLSYGRRHPRTAEHHFHLGMMLVESGRLLDSLEPLREAHAAHVELAAMAPARLGDRDTSATALADALLDAAERSLQAAPETARSYLREAEAVLQPILERIARRAARATGHTSADPRPRPQPDPESDPDPEPEPEPELEADATALAARLRTISTSLESRAAEHGR